MKFYLSQIIPLFKKIEEQQVKSLLLYGPDKGYIDKITNTLIKRFNLLKTSIEYSDLKKSSLAVLANTQNFFMQKQLIKVRSVGETIDKSLKLALQNELGHFVVFIADELSSNSTIRKFFETENHLASLACYHDGEQQIAKIILQKFTKVGQDIQKEAVRYLTENLTGDHQLIVNEIDKLIYFTMEQAQVTLEDAQAVIAASSIGHGDNLCIYFALHNLPAFLQEFTKLKQQNINEVLMIRALIRYYINLYTVLNKIADNVKIEDAIQSLSPPIFYKNIPSLKQAINNINIVECIKVLRYLQQAELDYKLNPTGFDIYNQLYVKCVR